MRSDTRGDKRAIDKRDWGLPPEQAHFVRCLPQEALQLLAVAANNEARVAIVAGVATDLVAKGFLTVGPCNELYATEAGLRALCMRPTVPSPAGNGIAKAHWD